MTDFCRRQNDFSKNLRKVDSLKHQYTTVSVSFVMLHACFINIKIILISRSSCTKVCSRCSFTVSTSNSLTAVW